MTRRDLLLGVLAVLAAGTRRPAHAADQTGARGYEAEIGVLYGMFSVRLVGSIRERVDRAAGRYEVAITGEGERGAYRVQADGLWQDGRWAPLSFQSRLSVHGRESELDITYDYAAGSAELRGRSETFVLRRPRITRGVVPVGRGVRVDDPISVALNYADRSWAADGDGVLRTHIVRRRREEGGADDVEGRYGAELVPFALSLSPGSSGDEILGTFDLSGFSSWAWKDRPARVVFGPDRRPRAISSDLILGTHLAVRVG